MGAQITSAATRYVASTDLLKQRGQRLEHTVLLRLAKGSESFPEGLVCSSGKCAFACRLKTSISHADNFYFQAEIAGVFGALEPRAARCVAAPGPLLGRLPSAAPPR
jgi:hypothetical protein